MPVGPDYPYLPATEGFAQCVQHAYFVAHPLDAHRSVTRQYEILPGRRHHPFHRDLLVRIIGPGRVASVAAQQVERFDDGPMCGVVRAELQSVQYRGQHPAVVSPVRGYQTRMDVQAEDRTCALGFFDKVSQRPLPHHGEEYLSYRSFRMLHGSLGHPEEYVRLAVYPLEVFKELLLYPAFGSGAYPVDDLDEELD